MLIDEVNQALGSIAPTLTNLEGLELKLAQMADAPPVEKVSFEIRQKEYIETKISQLIDEYIAKQQAIMCKWYQQMTLLKFGAHPKQLMKTVSLGDQISSKISKQVQGDKQAD